MIISEIIQDKNQFFKLLKIIYADVYIASSDNALSFELTNALNLFQLVEDVIPALLSGYEVNEEILNGRYNESNVIRFIDALKAVKVFPELHLNDINLNGFGELRVFLEFVRQFHANPVIKKQNGSIHLVDKSSGYWKLDDGDHALEFLKAYLAYRYKTQKDQNRHIKQQLDDIQAISDYQDEAIIKIAETVKKDIFLLLKKAGMLYVVAVRISFKKDKERPSGFNKFLNNKSRLFNCLQDNQNIVYMMYKPFLETDDTLEYYAVFFVQSASNLNEDNFVKKIETDLSVGLSKEHDSSVQIYAQNLNNVLRQSFLPDFESKHFLLIDGVDGGWEFTQTWFLEFLYRLEQLGQIQAKPLSPANLYLPSNYSTRFQLIRLRAGEYKIEPELIYRQFSNVQNIQHLLFFGSTQRARYIWDVSHLSDHAKEYVRRISVIYQENFAMWGMQQYVALAIRIEIFILTLTENNFKAFYPHSNNASRLPKIDVDIENLITRQLLQFAVICTDKITLDALKQKIEKKIISKTLKYFFAIYARQLRDDSTALTLDIFLGLALHDQAIRDKLEKIIGEYKFTSPIFFKPEPRRQQIRNRIEKIQVEMDEAEFGQLRIEEDQPPVAGHTEFESLLESTSDINIVEGLDLIVEESLQHDEAPSRSIESTAVSVQFDEVPHKLIHVQRHVSRLIKVQNMLKQALRTDVVIIRCLFCCNPSSQLDYKVFSQIFSSMLQDNKKRKPLSEMTAYLGYWEGRERYRDKITNYAANVVLIFKAQALLEYPDLFAELERAWGLACQKIERDCDLGMRISGYVEKLKIFHALESFQRNQLQVETTQKKLAKTFIEHLATFTVYQDLLDDDIYQELPKWLIKKNGSVRKSKTRLLKMT